jgi:hypothetical protein
MHSENEIVPTELYVVNGGGNTLFTIANALYESIPVFVFKTDSEVPKIIEFLDDK